MLIIRVDIQLSFEVIYTQAIAMVMAKKNGAWKMDVILHNITPFTSIPKIEDPPFVNLMGTCPMLVDVWVGTILADVND